MPSRSFSRTFIIFSIGLILLGLSAAGGQPAAANTSAPGLWSGKYLHLAEEDNWKWSPAVAYAPQHDRYLVVWENIWPGTDHHNIYGRLVGADSAVSAEFIVYNDTYNSLQPAVAYDSTHNRFLVVWSYDSQGNGTDNDIMGRFIPWNGPTAGETAFGIDNSRANSDKPRLAYGVTADEFLIVWKVEADATHPSYIAGGLIYADKTGKAVAISGMEAPDIRDFPDVTYNLMRNEFVAVWDDDVNRVGQDLDIHAIRLDWAGVAQPPGEFQVTTSTLNEQHPSVAACSAADQYLITWQQQVNNDPKPPDNSPDDNIFGRVMSGTGAMGQIYGIEGTTLRQRYPRLSCNPTGTEFMMVWHDQYAQPVFMYGVWAAIIRPNLVVEPGFEVVRPSDTRDRLYPAVAYGEKTALVVWQHAREDSNYLDIWGQVVMPYTSFLPAMRKSLP
jgi:hypothetical protein